MSLFSANQLTRYISPSQILFKEVSFELQMGECLGIFGSSGSGKTQLLRTLAGLDGSDSGEILFRQRSLQSYDMPEYRSLVMYLAQTPSFHKGTIQENLKIPRDFEIFRKRDTNPAQRCQQGFKDLGLNDLIHEKNIMHLSGGERQKIAFLRAFQFNPEILLLDEPTAAMDPESSQQFESMIKTWLKKNKACIWISHHREQLSRMANKTYHMSDQGLNQIH